VLADYIGTHSVQIIGPFLEDLFQQRKEFGRLPCVLADVSRRQRELRQLGTRR
jgi:hypothetical protein